MSQTVTGVLQVHPSGRGFVARGEAYEDVLVGRFDLGGAIDGDTVEVETWPGREREVGRVLRVLNRGRVRLTGVLRAGTPLQVEPDDPRLLHRVEVSVSDVAARPGQAVLAAIVRYPEERDDPLVVRLARALGEPGLLLTEVAKAIAGSGIVEEFPPEVLAQAAGLPTRVQATDQHGRLDLRALPFVTIDPLTARDFDDAVVVEGEAPGGAMRVWVAVADVSHYVPEGSPADREAVQRGCSLYLPDRAIPMLPAALSSGICSLVPQRDRLAMAVRMDVTSRGEVVDQACSPAVIHSRGRLDYAGVAAALQGHYQGRRAAYREHAAQLAALQQVASVLRRRRLDRGSLDLDLPEARVELDEDDPSRVRDIVESRADEPIKRAYNLIEELMVAANEAVARLFLRADAPTIWRVHPAPRHDALLLLREWLSSYGVLLRSKTSASHGIAQAVRQLEGHRAARPLSYLVLRTLKQAAYSVDNVGHFGLASPAYLHFTSPIRRYPDLHVHRLLKALLSEHAPRVRASHPGALELIANETSARERRAIEVEREVHRVYACSLMRDRLGDRGWGTITGVNSFGFFVTLDHPAVEGLVKLETLGERMRFDAEHLRLVSQRSGGRVFSLGDRVFVQVQDTSVMERHIDLVVVPGAQHHEPDPAAQQLTWQEHGRAARRKERRGGRRAARQLPRGARAGRGRPTRRR